MNRRQEREQAFILIFEKEFNADEDIKSIIDSSKAAGFIESNEFSENLAVTCCENMDDIDREISENSIGWNIDRISKTALAVLRVAVCEIKYFDDIPVKVSINEAVELSKLYATKEDAAFINGILGTISGKNN